MKMRSKARERVIYGKWSARAAATTREWWQRCYPNSSDVV
jgi:hypothetical protein